VLDSRLAGLADLYFLSPRFLFIEDLYVVSLANRAFSPAVGRQFPD